MCFNIRFTYFEQITSTAGWFDTFTLQSFIFLTCASPSGAALCLLVSVPWSLDTHTWGHLQSPMDLPNPAYLWTVQRRAPDPSPGLKPRTCLTWGECGLAGATQKLNKLIMGPLIWFSPERFCPCRSCGDSRWRGKSYFSDYEPWISCCSCRGRDVALVCVWFCLIKNT